MKSFRGVSRSVEETYAIGKRLALLTPPNTVIAFFGDLGAGKTAFIKGFASAASQCPIDEICSPTFTYLNIYPGRTPVFHFDLYRLHDEDEFLSMGFDEYFTAGGICCIEWSERIPKLLGNDCVSVHLSHRGGDTREIEINGIIKEHEELFA